MIDPEYETHFKPIKDKQIGLIYTWLHFPPIYAKIYEATE